MQTRNTGAFWTKPAAAWQGEEVDLICCEVRQETHDVKSFFFTAADASQFHFSPGQFITLELAIGGETISRCYTISSAPTRPHSISITVKRHPNGIVSNWLHDNINIGSKIAAFGPNGEFTTADLKAEKYLFLSAGSGVTPLMSMTRAFHELAENQDVVFIHSARSPDDIIFRKELDLIAFNQPKFHAAYICEQITDALRSPSDLSNMLAGRLTLEALTQLVPDFKSREIFTCGPAPYMAAVRTILGAAGFDMAHYHEESFTFDALPNSVQATETAAKPASSHDGAAFSVQFTKSERTLDCGANEFVLDAALKSGLRLPFACSKGVCGTCKSKLLSGKVDMKHGGGIRQREIDAGMILICCSKPLSDLVVEK